MAGEDTSTPSSGSSDNLPYYCYTCQTRIQPITEEMICPHCRDGFVVSNDERDLVEGENSGQQIAQQEQQPQQRGPVNYNMVETSLRNAMNLGIMQPGVISFSINGQPPTQMTIPGPPPTSNTTTSGSSRASGTSTTAAGAGGSISGPGRIFSSLLRGSNNATTSAAASSGGAEGGLPEIEMIHDIISRVFGNGAEALIGPHAAHNASGTTGREVSSSSGATSNNATAASGTAARIIDSVPNPPLWRMGELHGNPQDYAWGQNGFDNIISQLLGQLDNVGPPPAATETIDNLPTIKISLKNIEDLAECSVCMDFFKLDEVVKKLPCNHLFHPPCIDPWLNLHNTCPICRKQVGRSTPASATRRQPGLAETDTPAPANFHQRMTRVPRHTGSQGHASFRWNPRSRSLTTVGNPLHSSYTQHIPSPPPATGGLSARTPFFIPPPSVAVRSGPAAPFASGGAAEALFFPFFSHSARSLLAAPPTTPSNPAPPSGGAAARDPTTGEDQPPQGGGSGGDGPSSAAS